MSSFPLPLNNLLDLQDEFDILIFQVFLMVLRRVYYHLLAR